MIDDNANMGMQAMVFAAGLGTRLKPLTDHTPKAMIKVCGQPLLWHVLRRLSNAGAKRIVINVHHLADQITSYLALNNNFGLDIMISDESDQLLDTGGGLRKARPCFTASDPILIHNVDILSNVDIADFYRQMSGDATLLVSPRQSTRQLLFDDDMRLVGWTNIETGQVRSPYPDLKAEKCRHYGFSGIHCLSTTLLSLMDAWPERFGIMDFYLSVCRDTHITGFVKENLRLMDVGKADTLKQAEQFVRTLDKK